MLSSRLWNFTWALAALAPLAEARERWWEMLAKAGTKQSDESTPLNMEYFPSTSNTTSLEPRFFPQYGSQRAKVTYGPFEVQPMDQENGMVDFIQVGASMPCENCTITFVQAGLEYPNGSYANANTSLWLHHIVLIDHDETDTVCGKNFYGQGRRWFASGNERTPGDICRGGTVPNGYYIAAGDMTILVVELMNQAMENQTAVPTLEFEYIPGFPSDFYKANPIWMDIGGCGGSDEPAKTNDTFSYTSPTYTVDFSGAIVAEGAHLHDGGTTLEIKRNNSTSCLCSAFYGQTAGYYDAPGTMYDMTTGGTDPFGEADMQSMDHVSEITGCYAPTGMLQPGDEISIVANYDFKSHMPMLNYDGSLADIMGISIIYAAENMSQETLAKFAQTPAPPIIRPTLIDPAMEMGGQDTGDTSTMNMPMTCSSADSPGNLSTVGLDMTVPVIQIAFLTAILDDACLQIWSRAYTQYLWYVAAAVIGLFTLKRAVRLGKLTLRVRAAAANRLSSPRPVPEGVMKLFRSISYRQRTPTGVPRLFKVPALGALSILAGYLALILCLVFIRSSTGDDQSYQSIGVRAAWITVGQLPLVVLLATKRNFIDMLTGIGYERLNVIHRWVARTLFLTATFHFGFQNEGWRRLGLMKLEWSIDTCPPTGIAAYAILLWINISNLPPFRSMSYEFFVLQHIISFFGLIIAIMLHIPSTALFARTYVFIAVGIYLFCRLIQTAIYLYRNVQPGRAMVEQLSPSVVRIRIAGTRLKTWRPGSFILLGIPRLGLLQSHPATIASIPTSHENDIVLILRAHRGITRRLLQSAGDNAKRIALVDGPYGGKQDDLAAYSTSTLVVGSTGISFALPILADLAKRAASQKLPLTRFHLIWATKEQGLVDALLPEIDQHLQSLRHHGIHVVSSVHVTGNIRSSATGAVIVEKESSDNISEGPTESLGKGAENSVEARPCSHRTDSASSNSSAGEGQERVNRGRPTLSTLLPAIRSSAGEHDEMGVAVCGPLSMSWDVRNIVSELPGTYLHVEGFSW